MGKASNRKKFGKGITVPSQHFQISILGQPINVNMVGTTLKCLDVYYNLNTGFHAKFGKSTNSWFTIICTVDNNTMRWQIVNLTDDAPDTLRNGGFRDQTMDLKHGVYEFEYALAALHTKVGIKCDSLRNALLNMYPQYS